MGWATRVKGVLRLAKRGASDVELKLYAEIRWHSPNDAHPSEEDGETTGTKERRLY
jgi:hypothetical protein